MLDITTKRCYTIAVIKKITTNFPEVLYHEKGSHRMCGWQTGKAGIAMIYDRTYQILAQGNFVLAVSEGTFGGKPTSYYDLWRVENGKIAEHWDVMETIADKATWQNQNGKF